jgi:hypothetical protein
MPEMETDGFVESAEDENTEMVEETMEEVASE